MTGKRRLFTLSDGTRVYRVSGPAVRRKHVEFVQGGHGLVYRWIPKNEIWIEKMLNRKDECHIMLHEVVEHQLMRHKHMTYTTAHKVANRVESFRRRKGTDSCKKIQEELD